MTTRNHFNVIVLAHVEGDITIADMRVIAAWATETTETAQEVVDRVTEEASNSGKYAYDRVTVYVQPYTKN